MKRAVLASMLFPLLPTCAYADDPVQFGDPRLKAAVEDALWITDPTPDDLLGLTVLNCARGWDEKDERISDLTGLEHALNLQELNLRLNAISDVSPLSSLTNLSTLDLSQNHVTNLSPFSGMTGLRDLDLHGNGISDISPLSGLTGLYRLVLRENEISDISPLSGLTDLGRLNLNSNRIRDISPLLSLISLSYLGVRHNRLTQEAYDVIIPQIIKNNPGVLVHHDSHAGELLSVSSTIGGSVIDPGEGEFLYDYDAVVRIEAKADPCFVFAQWSGDYASTENPHFLRMDWDYQIQASFLSMRTALHVDDDGIDDPAPGNSTASDPREDGSPEHPFDSIQEAIGVAGEGMTIVVRPGTYRENLRLFPRGVHVIGADPQDPIRGGYPLITGATYGPVVHFPAEQGAERRLTGFVITGGYGYSTGAILCEDARVEITHCLIVGNRSTAPETAAVYCTDSEAALRNCTIVDNHADWSGAALMLVDSDVMVRDSILWNPAMTNEVLVIGQSETNIQYCGVRGWWPDWGNIHKDPLFARPGSWVSESSPDKVVIPQDPQAVWTTGDYHLLSQAGRWSPTVYKWVQDEVTSPCIDRGDPANPVGYEPYPNGGIVNMGAYGGTSEASMSVGVPPP